MLFALIPLVALYVGILGVILFGAAGRVDLPFFWAYLLIVLIPALYATITVYRRNPDLIKEQMKPKEKSADRIGVPMTYVCFLGHWIIAGLDVGRYHWSDTVPYALQLIGLIGFACGFSLLVWATITNQFYSSAVRIQTDRGQTVISGGPYRFVRHPGYIGWIVFYISSGFALGSWLSVLPMLLLVVITFRRTLIEDALLQKDLPGYADYAHRVPYRLIPGVW